MRECSETITVLNRRTDPSTGLDDWLPTVIHGVSWHGRANVSITTTGLKCADTATVRIPVDADSGARVYLDPVAYKATNTPSGAYTLARGDIIVRA